MATGASHYRVAERLVDQVQAQMIGNIDVAMDNIDVAQAAIATAQVHATLALAAATAFGTTEIPADGETAHEWRRAVCIPRPVRS